MVSGNGEEGSFPTGRFHFLHSWWKVLVVGLGAGFFLICGLVMILSFVPPRVVGAEAKYFFAPDGGLFAEVSYPLKALERSFLQLKRPGGGATSYIWTADGWEERQLLSYGWDYGKGGRARLVVPDSRWKVEVTVAPRHQIEIAGWTFALPVRTNLVVSAEFPPRREIEASLKVPTGGHRSEAGGGRTADSSVN